MRHVTITNNDENASFVLINIFIQDGSIWRHRSELKLRPVKFCCRAFIWQRGPCMGATAGGTGGMPHPCWWQPKKVKCPGSYSFID